MRDPRKQSPRKEWPKSPKHRDKPPATGNKRLAEQTRKILGKHYANKYRGGNIAAMLIIINARTWG
jgi:hypothetical protein